jgi:peroxiredoxin family protein
MSAVLDIFLMQPFGARSLLQRIFGMAISDGIMSIQKSIDILISQKIQDSVLASKIKQYTESDTDIKEELKEEAKEEQVDVLVCIMRSDYFEPPATPEQIETVFNGYVAWHNVVENVSYHCRFDNVSR